ncbi:hypothetical protein AM500_04820 [Bacillus sp. FJAT-18017]|uniref:SGNH/GDSL hydrolase family protein n=1 Tax=Bacillus sp. FJAT-18017 TaxID=1705566 RepID=UPI0006B02DA5|nr:SGNH/GDSL hydrolase family protein [Bacillus sp. FJAT-18017]ALC89186.1 hypothetical protein AM500_04820 [Bacillus sp. FJAT-18017]
MKVFLSIVLAIACAAVLILGNVHWKENVIKSGDSSVVAKETESTSPSSNEGSSKVAKEKEDSPEGALLSLTKNWPTDSFETLKQKLADKEPFKLVIVGSNAVGNNPNGWAHLVDEGITKAFGEEVIEVDVIKYESTTTDYVGYTMHGQLSDLKPDMVIFEPFLLNDNSIVRIEDTLVNISTVIEEVKSANPQAEFILQPPNPIFQPKMYKTQVAELERYANENGIVYFNHWESWPDPKSEEIYDYVDKKTNQPNKDGHKLWSDFILDYLIAQ